MEETSGRAAEEGSLASTEYLIQMKIYVNRVDPGG